MILLFFVGQPAEAGLIADHCSCVLSNQDSRCSAQAAQSICMDISFIRDVVNKKGVNFVLRDETGSDLGLVRVTDTEFKIGGITKLFYSGYYVNIINPDLEIEFIVKKDPDSFVYLKDLEIYGGRRRNPDTGLAEDVPGAKSIVIEAGRWIYLNRRVLVKNKVSLVAENLVRYNQIVIDEAPGEVFLSAVDGVVFGTGAIMNVPGFYESGLGGDVFISAKKVQIGDISTDGLSADGGDVIIYGEDIVVGKISTKSVVGYVGINFNQALFGKSGKIIFRGSDGSPRINFLEAGALYAQGVSPPDIEIEANERIWISKEIYNYSGCSAIAEPKCDYGNLCSQRIGRYRKFCSAFNPGGRVVLKAYGAGMNRGINIGFKINNGATGSNSYVGLEPGYSGAGMAGQVHLEAPNGTVHVGFGGIDSIGFHSSGNAVYIKGTWVSIDGEVDASIFNVPAFPGELAGASGGAGDIFIETAPINPVFEPNSGKVCESASNCSAGEECVKNECIMKPIIYFASISTTSSYPFAPDGGNVVLRSDYRIESDRVLEVNTSGASLRHDFSNFSYWYVIEGVSKSPLGSGPDNYINPEYFCDGFREYFDSAGNASDGLRGGNGGDITITADVIQQECHDESSTRVGNLLLNNCLLFGNSLYLIANGGNGSCGGYGGDGGYCDNFLGPMSHVFPKIGTGGAGGDGGNGGDITVKANKLHCFSQARLASFGVGFSISSTGGWGGRSQGVASLKSSIYGDANSHTGNCDLGGWGSGTVPEIEPPKPAGRGGNGGKVILSPMPSGRVTLGIKSDAGVGNVKIDARGGPGGYMSRDQVISYPWYCENMVGTSNKTRGEELVKIKIEVEECKKDILEKSKECYGKQGDTPPSGCYSFIERAKREDCFKECARGYYRALAECQYKSLDNGIDVDESGFYLSPGFSGYQDGISGNANCCNAGQDYIGCYVSMEDGAEKHAEICRSKIVQTPCQTHGFNEKKFNYYRAMLDRDEDTGFFKVKQAKSGAFDGTDGAKGGDGGKISTDSPLASINADGEIWQKDFFVAGGTGGGGSTGQNSFVDKPGDGGEGGDGGNAGTVGVTNLDLVRSGSIYTEGGVRGWAGYKGICSLSIPRSDMFCYDYFWDYNNICSSGESYCCQEAFMTSCRTKKPFSAQGGLAYSVYALPIYFKPDAENGKPGANGNDADLSAVATAKFQGPESCPLLPNSVKLEFPGWTTHKICYNGACVSALDEGLSVCTGSNVEEVCPLDNRVPQILDKKANYNRFYGPGVHSVSFEWTYKDLEDDEQAEYEIKIANKDFNDSAFDDRPYPQGNLYTIYKDSKAVKSGEKSVSLSFIIRQDLTADTSDNIIGFLPNKGDSYYWYARVKAGTGNQNWTEWDPFFPGFIHAQPWHSPGFSWTKDGLEVAFQDEMIFYDDNPAGRSWFWDFGDGTTSNLQNPNHIYSGEEVYRVVLEVTDSDGYTAEASHNINLRPKPPVPQWEESPSF